MFETSVPKVLRTALVTGAAIVVLATCGRSGFKAAGDAMHAIGDAFEADAVAAGDSSRGGSSDPSNLILEQGVIPSSGTIIEGPAVIELLFVDNEYAYVRDVGDSGCTARFHFGIGDSKTYRINLPPGKQLCSKPNIAFLVSGYLP